MKTMSEIINRINTLEDREAGLVEDLEEAQSNDLQADLNDQLSAVRKELAELESV